MPTLATKSSGVCERLRSALGSLCCESAIISLTLVSVLAISGEILIDYGVLTVPSNQKGQQWTASRGDNQTTNGSAVSSDLQSSTTSTSNREEEGRQTIELVQKVFHYISLSIAGLFFIEMVLKLVVYRLQFFVKHWQIFDMLVVLVTVLVEIAFEAKSRMPELEACTFVIIFRLIRLPHTCSIKARKVQRELEQDIDLWKAGKCKLEDKCANLEGRNNKQKERIERLERELNALKKEAKEAQRSSRSSDQVVTLNGSVLRNIGTNIFTGSNQSLDYAHQVTSADQSQNNKPSLHRYISADLDFDDVDGLNKTNMKGSVRRVDSKDTETDTMDEDEDGSGELRSPDRHHVRSGSESSLSCQGVLEHEVHVQIEGQSDERDMLATVVMHETSSNKMDSAPCAPVKLRKKARKEEKDYLGRDDDSPRNSVVYYDNSGYSNELDDDELHHGGVLVHEIDGTKTYRSADGIPMTDL